MKLSRLLSAWVCAACLLALYGCVAAPIEPIGPMSRVSAVVVVHACDAAFVRDLDADNLDDDCELALATAFAPELVLDADACDQDASTGLPRGGWLWGAQRAGERVRIVYLPAYEVDCGWEGPKCWVLFWQCERHAGDSEIIAVEVTASGEGWSSTGVFLSAHCFDDAWCRWYRGAELNQFAWRDNAPVVWVSRGKHANYPSRSSCDRGHYAMDTCDRNDLHLRYPVDTLRNIGSMAHPFMGRGDCVTADPDRSGVRECFWEERPFTGWQSGARGVTAYVVYLRQLFGFQTFGADYPG